MTDYTLGFCFDEDGDNVALIRKVRPAWQANLWNGIGGHVEPNESAVEAQSREFLEETGVTIVPLDWQKFGLMWGPHFQVHMFVAYTEKVWEVDTKTDEKVEVFTFGPEMCDDCTSGVKLLPNLRWLIPLAADFKRSPSYTECRYVD